MLYSSLQYWQFVCLVACCLLPEETESLADFMVTLLQNPNLTPGYTGI